MGDQFSSFDPEPLKNMTLPEGYAIDGIVDDQGVYGYCWYTTPPLADMEFGDNVSCRSKAYKGAWEHSIRRRRRFTPSAFSQSTVALFCASAEAGHQRCGPHVCPDQGRAGESGLQRTPCGILGGLSNGTGVR